MLRMLLCVFLVAGVLIAGMPKTAVATEAAPLTKAELARYAQLQAAALENDVLGRDGGLDEQTTWILIGVGVVVIVALAIWVW